MKNLGSSFQPQKDEQERRAIQHVQRKKEQGPGIHPLCRRSVDYFAMQVQNWNIVGQPHRSSSLQALFVLYHAFSAECIYIEYRRKECYILFELTSN